MFPAGIPENLSDFLVKDIVTFWRKTHYVVQKSSEQMSEEHIILSTWTTVTTFSLKGEGGVLLDFRSLLLC